MREFARMLVLQGHCPLVLSLNHHNIQIPYLQIHRNGVSVASVSNGDNGKSMAGQSILLDLAEGDEIRLFNFGGDIYDDPTTSESYLHFIGALLYSSGGKQ